jgi:hypothetical protein
LQTISRLSHPHRNTPLPTLSPHEAALLARVKDTQDSDALVELINLHTGIYYAIASRWARANPDVIKMDEMDDNKMSHIYDFIIAYKPDKDTKLSTYIGDRTKYLCQDIIKKAHHNPLSPAVDMPAYESVDGGIEEVGKNEGVQVEGDANRSANGAAVYVVDQTPAARPAEVADATVGIDDINRLIEGLDDKLDKRFGLLLQYRHFTNPPLTWRAISAKVQLTHEGCRQIYVKNVEIVKKAVGAKWEEMLNLGADLKGAHGSG